MNIPTYIPVLRFRQEEKKVLTTFDFGPEIFPYVEIFKEFERLPPKLKPGISKTIRKFRHNALFFKNRLGYSPDLK